MFTSLAPSRRTIHVDMDDLAVSHFGSVLILVRRHAQRVLQNPLTWIPIFEERQEKPQTDLHRVSASRIRCVRCRGIDLPAISPVAESN